MYNCHFFPFNIVKMNIGNGRRTRPVGTGKMIRCMNIINRWATYIVFGIFQILLQLLTYAFESVSIHDKYAFNVNLNILRFKYRKKYTYIQFTQTK